MSETPNANSTLVNGHVVIDSRYRLLEKIGEGGMGIVYKARDTRLGRLLAVKLLGGISDNENYRARFYREARAASKLNHPHIATVHDYGTTPDGQPFIVMELLEGATLAKLIEGGSLPVEGAIKVTMAIAEALAEAHRQGIIHRDIKPSNVIVSDNSRVKVLDFGLAKEIAPLRMNNMEDHGPATMVRTQSGVVVGTPLYLSPEQARGADIDGRSDLFSLGSLLYECLTGQPAFAGRGVMEICTHVIHVDPPPPSRINPAVPAELDRLNLKTLAKDPADRYQSAEELLTELRQINTLIENLAFASTKHLPIGGSARSGVKISTRFWRRHPRVSVLLGVLLLAVTIVSVWAAAHRYPGASLPGSSEALRSSYDRGTQNLRDGAYFQASKALEQAVAIDNTYALAHARLAEALMELDVMDRAQHEILIADDGRGALGQADQLRFDAIKTTVKRDFPKAVEAYSALKQLNPNEPGIYVDLGRAYEKNYEIDKAIDSYEQATKLNSQEAAAFLRLGGLYGRKRESEKALAAFSKAESIYQAMSNTEGYAEILYQRGYFYNLASKYQESSANLQESLKIARSTGNTYQQIRILLQMSLVDCFDGQPVQSQQIASDALSMAQANGFDVLTAQALIGLGSACHCAGRDNEAEKNFQQGLALARRHDARSTEAKSLLSLGSLQITAGKTDEGLINVKQALAFYQQQGGDIDAVMRAQTLIGRASRNKGDFNTALEAFSGLLSRAEQLNDIEQISLSHDGLGSVMLLQERYPDALKEYEASLKMDESAQDQTGIGYSSSNCGNTLCRLGRYIEADKMFLRALNIAKSPEGYKDLLVEIQINQLEESLSRRQFSTVLNNAEKLFNAVDPKDAKSIIRIKKALAFARLSTGDRAGAKTLCDEALAKAVELGEPAMIYSARLSQSEVLLNTNETAKALEIIVADLSHFINQNQLESSWRAYVTAARASQELGDLSKAGRYASKGLEVFSVIEGNWGAEAYKKYTARQDVSMPLSYLNKLTGYRGP